jgi:hypothetical protein
MTTFQIEITCSNGFNNKFYCMLTFYHNPQSFHDDGVWSPMETFEYAILNYPEKEWVCIPKQGSKKQVMTI